MLGGEEVIGEMKLNFSSAIELQRPYVDEFSVMCSKDLFWKALQDKVDEGSPA